MSGRSVANKKPDPAAARAAEPAAPAAAPAAAAAQPARAPAPPPEPVAMPPLRDITVRVTAGTAPIAFQVADAPEGEVFFAFGVRKSGSTLLNRVMNFLSRKNGVNPVDMPGTFFRYGFSAQDWTRTDLSGVVTPGNVYIGFRSFPSNMTASAHYAAAKKVFLFRDPRDALVSQYFSDAYSHSLPSRDTETGAKAAEAFEKRRTEALALDVEAYVLKHAKAIDQTLIAYAPMLNEPSCLVLRYEDCVFQKKRMIHKILQHFDWTCPPGAVEALMKLVDEVPEQEDQERFVRRVIPGDHRAKLSPEAVRKLSHQLRESLRLYDYY